MLYRILTENQNYDEIKKLLNEWFDNATIIKANGLWQDKTEHSLIIEIDSIIDYQVIISDIEQLCYQIKKLNQQDKILVQIINCNSRLI